MGAVIVLMIMSGCPSHVAANVSKIAGSMAISKGKKPGLKKAGSKPAAKKGAGAKSAAKMDRAGAAAKPKTPKPHSAREKLIAVKPSFGRRRLAAGYAGTKEDNFFDLVHEVARQIPKGRVTTYGAIGAALGTRGSARMVGWAMMAVPYAEKPVPAHRVVNRIGLLTGRHHYHPPEKMQQLLEKEGVKVVDNKVVDFKKLFWDPSQEL
jgi:methylated-DNA-protein-cysteine methyltransferase-like protein